MAQLHGSAPEVPHTIYYHLHKIAQLGYDSNDVRHWYMTVLRSVRRRGTENPETTFSAVTPVSDCSASWSDSQVLLFDDLNPASRRGTFGSPYVQPRANVEANGWWRTTQTNALMGVQNTPQTGTSMEAHATSPPTPRTQQLPAPAAPQRPRSPKKSYQRSHAESPALPSRSAPQAYMQSPSNCDVQQLSMISSAEADQQQMHDMMQDATNTSSIWTHPMHSTAGNFPGFIPELGIITDETNLTTGTPGQWYNPAGSNVYSNAPHADMAYVSPYSTTVPGTDTPLLMPTSRPGEFSAPDVSGPTSSAAAVSNSGMPTMGYLPAIAVVHSRKRRKTTQQQGAKKAMKPLQPAPR